MIENGHFQDQIELLEALLGKVSGVQSQIRVSPLNSQKYIFIAKQIESKNQNFQLEATISYHPVFRNPFVNFRVFEKFSESQNEFFFDIDDLDNDEEILNDQMIESIRAIQDISIVKKLLFGSNDKSVELEETMNKYGENELTPVGTHQEKSLIDDFFGITLDYHPIFQTQIWFYIHPCDAESLVINDNSSDLAYVLRWFSIYGKVLDINLDVKNLNLQKSCKFRNQLEN